MAVITISRQYGTDGINIGRQIAEKLDYRFMYVEELVEASRKRGLEIDLERIEGRPPNIIERLFGLNREKVRETIREVMEEAANAGNVIIGGWGGADPPQGQGRCTSRPDRWIGRVAHPPHHELRGRAPLPGRRNRREGQSLSKPVFTLLFQDRLF